MSKGKPCQYCGELFWPKRSDGRYCSAKCRVYGNRAGMTAPEPMKEELEQWLTESIKQAKTAQSETGRFKDFYAGHIQAFEQTLEWLRLANGENE